MIGVVFQRGEGKIRVPQRLLYSFPISNQTHFWKALTQNLQETHEYYGDICCSSCQQRKMLITAQRMELRFWNKQGEFRRTFDGDRGLQRDKVTSTPSL
jgi:hypothetical protein